MALIIMVIRKMFNQRWLMASWLIGLVITVALLSSIPIYTNGVLQNMLVQDVQAQQQNDNSYPGGLYNGVSFSNFNPTVSQIQGLKRYTDTTLRRTVGLPQMASVVELDTEALSLGQLGPRNRVDYQSFANDSVTLSSFSDLSSHILLVHGRMPAKGIVNGAYEVLVPQTAIGALGITLNQTFAVYPSYGSDPSQAVLIKPVGEFTEVSPRDVYWRASLDLYDNTFFIPENSFHNLFLTGHRHWVADALYYSVFHYPSIRLSDISRLTHVTDVLKKVDNQYFPGQEALIDFPVTSAFDTYVGQAAQLSLMMWSLVIPVLITLSVYIFMVSRLIVDRERTEISVLRSRGASRSQIIVGYFVEVGLLAAVALVVGPLLGLCLTEVVGASDGFLSFVSRVGLPVSLNRRAFEIGLLGDVGCIAIVLLAAFLATGESIVGRKRDVARGQKQALWHKYFLDFVLLGISWYGWSLIHRGHGQLLNARIDVSNGLQIDPVSFFTPALFTIGCSILFLRLYPLLVRFVHWIGNKHWPTSIHLGLLQVGRMAKQYQLFMLFLMMTVSIGGFSANAARTINQNLLNRIHYQDGADVTLMERWNSQQVGGLTQWIEPSFSYFSKLPGVVHAAEVFSEDGVSVKSSSGQQTNSTSLMAVVPYDFAQTAWFEPNLLRYHWWGYLNLLTEVPNGALISQTLADQLQAQVGDTISVHWQGVGSAQLLIEGIVKYWPSFNPLGAPDPTTNEPPTMIVANLSYIQQTMGLSPYNVWLKVKPGMTNAVYRTLQQDGVPLIAANSVEADTVQLKEDPFILGLNGTLTMGFLVVMLVSLIGFLLYWLLNLFGRRQQYGVFRAIGMPLRQLVVTIGVEQVLTSGVASIIGGVIGWAASALYVPQFDLYFSVSEQVPPFQLFFRLTDTLRIYAFVAVMLVVGGALIVWLLSRIRIYQALKLGDD